MDIFLYILAVVFALAGVAGSILPVLPGPPLAFVGLLLAHWSGFLSYSLTHMIFWGVTVLVITLLDYLLPVWMTKRAGGSRLSSRGAAIGLVFGFFLGPLGIILGPFIGAWLGESIHTRSFSGNSLRIAFFSFVGFITGTLLKLLVSIALLLNVLMALFL